MVTTTLFPVKPIATKLSAWQKFKRWCGKYVENTPVVQSLCCLGVGELEAYHLDNAIRKEVRESMCERIGQGKMDDVLANVINLVAREQAYNLGNDAVLRTANQGVKRTVREWDAYFARLEEKPALIIPRFASAAAIAVRSKLGPMGPTEANILLVQREYRSMCRKHGVRDVDIVSHEQFVTNTVFSETVLDHVSRVRSRLPDWLRWLDDLGQPERLAPTVC